VIYEENKKQKREEKREEKSIYMKKTKTKTILL